MKRLAIDEALLKRLYLEDRTQKEIAEILQCCRSVVERRAKKMGLSKDRTGPKRGDRHPDWKGGRKLVGGYWYIYSPDHPHMTKARYVLEHRLVMEKVLGRFLHPKEVVHHLDGNRQNNDPTNLLLYPSNVEHIVEHLLGNPEHAKRISEGMKKSPRWKANLDRLKRGVR